MIGSEKEVVMADPQYINSLKQQYFVREADGKLTKKEKDAVMKELIDVGKAVVKAKWGIF